MCDEDTAALVVDNGSGMCKVRILNWYFVTKIVLTYREKELFY